VFVSAGVGVAVVRGRRPQHGRVAVVPERPDHGRVLPKKAISVSGSSEPELGSTRATAVRRPATMAHPAIQRDR
jgi:hypothetical protein